MPKPDKIRKGFGFPSTGTVIDGFRVEEASIGHIEVERYRKYCYPIHYVFEGNGDEREIEKIFQKGRKTVVRTSYGNPYQCEIINESITKTGRKIKVDAVAICTRIPKSR